MVEKLGIERSIIPELGNLLYKNYGTTMAGLRVLFLYFPMFFAFLFTAKLLVESCITLGFLLFRQLAMTLTMMNITGTGKHFHLFILLYFVVLLVLKDY